MEPEPRPLDRDVPISWVDRDEAQAANARAAIDLAERSRAAGEAEAARYAKIRGGFVIGLGVVMGLITPVACGVRNKVVFIVAFVLYGLAVVVMSWVFNRFRGSSGRGWSRRYLTAFGLSMVLYVGSVLVSSYLRSANWVPWIPAGVLVALPLIVLGVIELRRGARVER